MITSKGNYISGKWQIGKGAEFVSRSPCDGSELWRGRVATNEEIHIAVENANDAFAYWSTLESSDRLAYLRLFVEKLKSNKAELAAIISQEIGKPRWEAVTEVSAMIGKLEPTEQAFQERNAGASRQLATGISRTRFRPHGVVAILGPYNFPGHMPNGHILPALLAGNTVVFKPSEFAPAVAELFVDYWNQCGLPAGVINLLHGDGNVGHSITIHKHVKGVFFTGGRTAGNAIRTAASSDTICALEMGGNSPLIVWDASNIEAAVLATVQSSFITTGQRCSAARRLIVPTNSFTGKFLDLLVEVTAHLRIGAPNENPEPYMGPLRRVEQVDILLQEQDRLIERGAVPLLKAERRSLGNAFVGPGIIDVTEVKERPDIEIFGPLLQVIRVPDFDAALSVANDTDYGLAAGLFSENSQLYTRFQQVVKAGILNWNQQLTGASGWAPFGGIKQSGNFRPSGYLAADYCVYATGSIECERLTPTSELPAGIVLSMPPKA